MKTSTDDSGVSSHNGIRLDGRLKFSALHQATLKTGIGNGIDLYI